MDPNACLELIRAHIAMARLATNQHDQQWEIAVAVEHFEALDEWLSKGGFLPTAWEFAAAAS